MNSALDLLKTHPFCADRLDGDRVLTLEPFRALASSRDPEDYARFGAALGAFHLEWKGRELPGLELHDAAWYSRAAPYVLAEVASRAETGEYELTLAQSGQLEEAGVILAELAEPLSGLLPSFVHGHCTLETAGFVGDRPCLRDWSLACAGLAWVDIATLSEGAEDTSQDVLVALVRSYAEAADYPVGTVGDLIPFCRALHDVFVLDHWNHALTRGEAPAGSFKRAARRPISRMLELSGA